jgi:hypothetical protein
VWVILIDYFRHIRISIYEEKENLYWRGSEMVC